MIDEFNNPYNSNRGPAMTGEAASGIPAVIAAGLPLESGLRALSEEAPTRQMRQTLLRLSDELAAGEAPEVVLTRTSGDLPGYLRGLVQAGVRTGQLGHFLEEFLQTLRARRAARHDYWLALAYPLLLLPLSFLAIAALLSFVVPQFKEIFLDFGVQLPAITRALILIGDVLTPPVAVGVVAGLVGLIALVRWRTFVSGGGAWTRFVQRLPLTGTASQMRGLSEFCSFLGLLVRGQLPLGEALRATAGVLEDANLSTCARQLAVKVDEGMSLAEAADQQSHIPAELRSLFRWEHRGTAFGEILGQAGNVFGARSQVEAGVVGLFFQPLLLLFIGGVLGLTVIGLFMPLVKLLNELS